MHPSSSMNTLQRQWVQLYITFSLKGNQETLVDNVMEPVQLIPLISLHVAST